MLAGVIYAACALTALACAVLLLRGYRNSGARLLGLTLNNVLVFLDLMVVPDVSLFTWRNLAALGAMSVLVFGLIWDAR
jgi:hypothetical protein